MTLLERYILKITFSAFAACLVALTGVIWITQALRELDLLTGKGQTLFIFLTVTGLSLPARVLAHPVVERVADLIPVALLAALVAVQVWSDGQELSIDARTAGLAFAVVALLLRAPFLVVVIGAAVVAALIRLI